MRKFRGITTTVAIVTAIFTAVLYTACNKPEYTPSPDKCEGVVCQHNGRCISGVCDCTAGYTGQYCENKANKLYIGRWKVTQELLTSDGQPVNGVVDSYEVDIAEATAGITFLDVSGFMGGGYSVQWRIGMKVELVKDEQGEYNEAEVQSSPSDFIFKRYQPLGQSGMQILKGEGQINSLGTGMGGEFYVIYADSVKGPVEDRWKFSAAFIQ